MCGICGQLRFDNNAVNQADIEKMQTKISRRGPDHSGIWLNNFIGFGHRRLSIIDLSNHAHQPMIDKDLDLVLTYNGTIYNYKELKKQLENKAYKFNSNSDTEVIIKAYHYWGKECVKQFDGMFAFCLWDNIKQELFIARDRMGVKPLYYTLDNNKFTFASNTQALLTTHIDKSINLKALNLQLSLHSVVPAPNTIIDSIKKVKPASTITINQQGEWLEETYWQPQAKRIGLTDDEYIQKTAQLLTHAVDKRMGTSDVPIGVLLSGGLDSSLLVGLLNQAGHKDIRTFSIGFENIGDEMGNEFKYSDSVVERFKTCHQKIMVNNSEVLSRLTEAVENMAEPMVSQDAIGFYLLSEQVSKHVKVVLSGQGADETFCGYFWYSRMHNESNTDVERFAKHYLDREYDEYLQTITRKYHSKDHARQWLSQEFSRDHADSFIDKVLVTEITKLIVDDPIKRVDNMTMAWGLEARVPFMDYQLVEHALSIPFALKSKKNGKYPLQKIARGLIPDVVIDRKKGYFPMPALKKVRGEFLAFMIDILKSSQCINRGIYNQKFINKIIAKPDEYITALQGSRLWHLALLECWLQVNVDS